MKCSVNLCKINLKPQDEFSVPANSVCSTGTTSSAANARSAEKTDQLAAGRFYQDKWEHLKEGAGAKARPLSL